MFFFCCWTRRVAVKASRLFARWKRRFSLGRWWMWCVRRCISLLAVSMSHCLSCSIYNFYPRSIIVHFFSFSHPTTFSLFPFLPFAFPCRMYYKWLSLFLPPLVPSLLSSMSSSSQRISCCHPEQKVTTRLVQGLQHRTWVLPLPTARVLCCSQWSCLPASVCLSTCCCWIKPPKTEDQVWPRFVQGLKAKYFKRKC